MSDMNTQAVEQPMNFDKIKIGLASPEMIRKWSCGEVKKPETINYRTLKPERDGLFCERIFGPSKDWECHCGKYKKIRYKGVVCDKCGVEVTKANVRRERMGHIELAAPVSHIWYFKGIPSRMGLILDMSPKDLEKVLYFASFVVLDAGKTSLNVKDILSDAEYRRICEEYRNNGEDMGSFRVGMGAEAVKELLDAIDLEAESVELKESLKNANGQKKARNIKRLEVVEAFRLSNNKPSWMVLDVVPVIPPDIRPMVQLDGGRFATSDLNDLYRRIINRNNRLKRLLDLGAPDIIIRNEKRMLQEAVDALIDNGRRGRAVTGPGNRALKSLSDMLKGKQGRFRQNLLGKRVDYSGRSVIVVGPELKIYQCGLPKEMAIELFKPFVMKELVSKGLAHNIKSAKKMVEKLQSEVWDVLENVIKEHPVMLNRAPTLHRLGIQAFEPILVEGKAIKLHPLVCTAFNADFDGDQMAVHLPLSVEAQAECRFLLLSPNNLLKPSDGAPVAVPSQDMVLGVYYLTMQKDGAKGEGKCFKSENEAYLAYENKVITLHSRIKVKRSFINADGEKESRMIDCTMGRILFNEIIPQDLGFVDRTNPENLLKLEIDFQCGKKQLKKILDKCISVHGTTRTAEVLDYVKALGYKFSTIGALSVSISDMTVPKEKPQILEDAQKKVEYITKQYRRGFMTEEERYKAVVSTWFAADNVLTDKLLQGLDKYNNIYMMADSGARGSNQQIKQLAGMRGLMADTSGRTIELPIKSNFREGLDVLEYFISAHGARKGLSDTALRTADSGYLTRRLVDVSQELIIREQDCCEGEDFIPSMEVEAIMDGKETIESLEDRISGRFAAEDYKDEDGNMIVAANCMITPKRASALVAAGYTKIRIRTMLSCKSQNGACSKCYGANLATGQAVQVGEAVGIIAAQSIGEPGTQLTMRTFHAGGVAGDDITQGLPRVEELFEARKPKGVAIITEVSGTVEIKESRDKGEVKREIIVKGEEEAKSYDIPYGARIKVLEGTYLEAGDALTEGPVNPHDILKIKGVRAVQDYMTREVQRVYRLQGVDINDKHIEIIVRQMLKKIRIEEPGDTDYLPGSLVDILELEETNKELEKQNAIIEEENRFLPEEEQKPLKVYAYGSQTLLGITKASLATNSFLSAASFQETTKVLTDAAIKGKIDPLIGLKENVLLGKLIPAGTGLKKYRNLSLKSMVENEAEDVNAYDDYDEDLTIDFEEIDSENETGEEE